MYIVEPNDVCILHEIETNLRCSEKKAGYFT